MYARLSKIEKHVEAMLTPERQNIFFNKEDWSIAIKDDDGVVLRVYTPEEAPIVKEFHGDKHFLHRLIMGPRGSSKSSGMCAEDLWIAYLNPPCKDGVKRSRFLIGRETYPELKSTSILTFEHWFGFDVLGWKITYDAPITGNLRFWDGEAFNEIEILFISFDHEKSAKKAMSLELTGAYFNECAGIPMAPMDAIIGSVGRYPAMSDKGEGHYSHCVIYDTNSFPDYHPLYARFVEEKAEGHKFYQQPGGLIEVMPGVFDENPKAENLKNLPVGYYKNMSLGKTLAFIRTQICNQFGVYDEGKPCHPEYDSSVHSVNKIDIDKRFPVSIFWDYGGVNAATIVQYVGGQLRIIKEFLGVRVGLTEFAKNTVGEYLKDNLSDCVIEYCEGDPSDAYSTESARNASQLVKSALGIETTRAVTNEIRARLSAVDGYILKTLGSGQRGLLVSKEGAPIIHAGLAGKYQLKLEKVGDEKIPVEKPLKNGWSHGCDTVQYAALRYAWREKLANAKRDRPVNKFNTWGNIQ